MEFSKSSGPFQQSIYVFLHNVFFSLICFKTSLQVIAGNFLQDALENCWYYFIIGFSWCLSKVVIFQEKTADCAMILQTFDSWHWHSWLLRNRNSFKLCQDKTLAHKYFCIYRKTNGRKAGKEKVGWGSDRVQQLTKYEISLRDRISFNWKELAQKQVGMQIRARAQNQRQPGAEAGRLRVGGFKLALKPTFLHEQDAREIRKGEAGNWSWAGKSCVNVELEWEGGKGWEGG